MKRKWKISNPPKKSGYYLGFYDKDTDPFQLYFDVTSNSWYPGLECYKLGYRALFQIYNKPQYRWSEI